ncbi:MAG TPA: helix-turn-helix domain-containing protein [Candidatus Paceibacterota bacterium]
MIQFKKVYLPGIVFYPQLRCVYTRDGTRRLKLSKRGTDLLEALALCKGMLVTNDMLIAIAYGRHGCRATVPTLRSAMFRFRSKLKCFADRIDIRHVRNFGYKLVAV